jgi:hypothetical protein
MRLTFKPRYFFHLLCIAAIASLSAFIFNERTNDHDAAIQAEWQRAMQSNFTEIKAYNGFILREIGKSVEAYRNPNSLKYGNIALLASAKTDTILVLLDSLKRNPNNKLVCEIQGKLSVFNSEMWGLMSYDTFRIDQRPKFKSSNWLYKSWKNVPKQQFLSILEETKLKVILIEKEVLIYSGKKTSGSNCDLRMDSYDPVISFNQINPEVGEILTADVFLTEYSHNTQNTAYKLNGEELPLKFEKGQFQVKYDKPGLYPMLFTLEKTNPMTDSVQIWGKTYYLRVQ